MSGRETLTLNWQGPARGPSAEPWRGPALDSPVFVLLHEVDDGPQMTAKARAAGRIRPKAIDAQVVGAMRDLVLVSYLGAQFPEGRDSAGLAPYTTELTRDCRPAGLTDEDRKTRGAEDLKRVTTRLHASETRPKKKGATLLGPFAYQDAHVVRTIGNLAPEYCHWLRYAYGDSKRWEDEQGAVVAVWARVQPLLGKIQAKTLQRVRALAHLAVQAGKARQNSGRELHGTEKLMQLLQVNRGNFDVNWAPRWKLYAEQIAQLDREALEALARALQGFEFVVTDRGV